MSSRALLLLDTHVWIWWVDQEPRLSEILKEAIESHESVVAVSTATIYETIVLVRKNRIAIDREADDWIDRATRGANIEVLPLDAVIACRAGNLPFHHGDPIDRLIIASTIHHDA